jgi:hypothetical protein
VTRTTKQQKLPQDIKHNQIDTRHAWQARERTKSGQEEEVVERPESNLSHFGCASAWGHGSRTGCCRLSHRNKEHNVKETNHHSDKKNTKMENDPNLLIDASRQRARRQNCEHHTKEVRKQAQERSSPWVRCRRTGGVVAPS